VLTRAAGHASLAGGQEDEMIEVGTRQTECTALPRERDPRVRPESFAALVAHRVAMRDEHLQVGVIGVRW
jgi:hypothetical protein